MVSLALQEHGHLNAFLQCPVFHYGTAVLRVKCAAARFKRTTTLEHRSQSTIMYFLTKKCTVWSDGPAGLKVPSSSALYKLSIWILHSGEARGKIQITERIPWRVGPDYGRFITCPCKGMKSNTLTSAIFYIAFAPEVKLNSIHLLNSIF